MYVCGKTSCGSHALGCSRGIDHENIWDAKRIAPGAREPKKAGQVVYKTATTQLQFTSKLEY